VFRVPRPGETVPGLGRAATREGARVSRPRAGVSDDVVEPGERPVKLALAVPSYGSFFPSERLHEIVGLTRMAEDAGVDTVVVPDHLVMSDRTDRYRWGRFPLPVDAPWLEPLTVLAAIAGATRRVRLATGILIAPLRPAALLAKTAATLDVLSRGRLDLGVGTVGRRRSSTRYSSTTAAAASSWTTRSPRVARSGAGAWRTSTPRRSASRRSGASPSPSSPGASRSGSPERSPRALSTT